MTMADEVQGGTAAPVTAPPVVPPQGEDPDVKAVMDKYGGDPIKIAKAYKEAERAMHAAKSKPTPEGGLEITDPQPEVIEDVPAEEVEVIRKAGLDPASLQAQWGREGKLTEDQYAAFKKAYGWSKATTNLMATGAAAKAEARDAKYNAAAEKATARFGGMDAVKTFLQTEAPKHLSEAERTHYTAMLKDPATIESAIIAVRALVTERSGSQVSIGAPISGDKPASYANGAKDAREFGTLMSKAQRGDKSAQEAIMRTPQSSIDQWQREVGIRR